MHTHDFPNGWEYTHLHKFSDDSKNAFVNGPFGSDLLSSELCDEGVPVVYIRDINGCRYQRRSVDCVTEEKANNLKFCETIFGDVIVSKVGDPPCNSAVYDAEERAIVTQDVIRIRPSVEVNPRFLSMLINSDIGRRRVHEIAIDGTRQRVSLTDFKKVRLPKPSKKEQDSIAATIDCWDRAIEITERLIAAKQERRIWLMQQLLSGRRRLPGFVSVWPGVQIRDIFKPVRRKNNKGVTHVLTASGEHGLVDQTEYFNRSVSGESLDGYYLLRRGEFAYNRSSMNGYPYGAIKRLDAYDEGVLSTLYLCFELSSEYCHSDFYKHLFEAGVLNEQLRKIVQVGARAHGLLNVTLHDFFALKLICPPIEEQKAIAATIDVAERELDLLRTQLDALREQKKGLMQQLLTGKVRVKVVS